MHSRIFITTGDVDGIGLEVTAKALSRIRPRKSEQFFVFASRKSEPKYVAFFKKISADTFFSFNEALASANKSKGGSLFFILSDSAPPDWVVSAAEYCTLHSRSSSLVTAPMSKTLIFKSGYKSLGHTELLADTLSISRKNLFMAFVGHHFSVVLATGHIPIKQIESQLTAARITVAIQAALRLRQCLAVALRRKPIGVLALNPHAGDSRLIGHFDSAKLSPLLAKLRKNKLPILGPLVPDAAFQSSQFLRSPVFVALYHDQGLIPFKALHGNDCGVHVTLGLPFLRASVDHGTAKDIFGKGLANPGSMIDALLFARKNCGVFYEN